MKRQSEANLRYQFNWNRIPGPDEAKFVDFIESISGPIYESFKGDDIFSHEVRKNEPPAYSYESLEELRAITGASHRTSEIALNILDSHHQLIGYFSLKLVFRTKTIKLEYIPYNRKSNELDTSDIIVKQDYGNFYIYKRQK